MAREMTLPFVACVKVWRSRREGLLEEVLRIEVTREIAGGKEDSEKHHDKKGVVRTSPPMVGFILCEGKEQNYERDDN
jgi:hypothetical protein